MKRAIRFIRLDNTDRNIIIKYVSKNSIVTSLGKQSFRLLALNLMNLKDSLRENYTQKDSASIS